jgi:dienelactone hydrolase
MNLFRTLLLFLLLSPCLVLAKSKAQTNYATPGTQSYAKQKPTVDLNTLKKYPDGYSLPGSLSYQSGNLKAWQNKTYPKFLKLMGINRGQVNSKGLRKQKIEIEHIDLQSDGFKRLLKPYTGAVSKPGDGSCKSENSQGYPLYADYYPPQYVEKIDHIVLYSCKKDDAGIQVYKIKYSAYQGQKISAYLFLPNNTKEAYYKKSGGKVPTLIYYHGHGSTKEDAAFNPRSYVRGIAYHAALNGYVVLAPDIRGFGESENGQGHKAIATSLRNKGSNFFAAIAMDTMYAQDFLESPHLKKMGLKRAIDKSFNVVAGISLGGQAALMSGAIDKRFEAVSTHGIFLGYEVVSSKFHCHCSHLPKLAGKLNIFDVALLISPRTVHIGMGGKDYFFNNYAKSAIEMLAYNLSENKQDICFGQNDNFGLDFIRNIAVKNRFKAGINCPLVLEIQKNAKHEVIGYGYQLHFFWHNYLDNR